MAAGISTRLTAAEGRKFAFTVGIAFLVLAAFALYRGRQTTAYVLGTPGVVLGVLGVLVPSRLGPVHAAWMGLAHAISKVTTPIFMGVSYFVVMTPIGLIKRLAGSRSLEHRPVNDSYWHEVKPRAERQSSMTRQF